MVLKGGVYNGDGTEAIIDTIETDLPSTVEEILSSELPDQPVREIEDNQPPQKSVSRGGCTSCFFSFGGLICCINILLFDCVLIFQLRRSSTIESQHYSEDTAIGVEFSGIYAYVHAGCLYGTILRLCQLTGKRSSLEMLRHQHINII